VPLATMLVSTGVDGAFLMLDPDQFNRTGNYTL